MIGSDEMAKPISNGPAENLDQEESVGCDGPNEVGQMDFGLYDLFSPVLVVQS